MIEDKKGIEPKEKNKGGRPTKYRPDMPERLLELMSDGLSFEACCGDLGISKETGYKWTREYMDFNVAKELGEVRGQLFWEKAAISGLWSDKNGSKFNTTAFIFIMKNRFGWRDRREISGSLGIGGLDETYKGWSTAQIEQEIGVILARMPKPEGPKRQ